MADERDTPRVIAGYGTVSNDSVFITGLVSLKKTETNLNIAKTKMLRRFCNSLLANPELIKMMPIFPVDHSSLLTRSDNEIATANERASIEAWIQEAGLNGIDELYSSFSFRLLNEQVECSSRVLELLPERDIQFNHLAEAMRFAFDEQRFFRDIELGATNLLATYVPDALPIEPAQTFPRYEPKYRPVNEYRGKIRGNHYITIGIPIDNSIPHTNPFRLMTPLEKTMYMYDLIHEKTHQRHAELVGQANFFGLDYEHIFESEEFSNVPTSDMLQKLKELKMKDRSPVGLSSAIKEGLAINVTHDILMKEIERTDREHDKETGSILHHIVDALRISIDTAPQNSWARVYKMGEQLMQGLYNSYGFIQLTSGINLDAACKISENSVQERLILGNPSILFNLH